MYMSNPDKQKQGVTRTDYEKEKIAALLVDYFQRRADVIALQAEIETKYPEVAERLREQLPDMKAVHEHSHSMYDTIMSDSTDQS